MHYLLLFFLFISTQTVQFIKSQEKKGDFGLLGLDALTFTPVGNNIANGLPAQFRLILGARCTDQPGTFRDFFSSNQSKDTYRIFVSKPQPNVFTVLTEQPSDGTAQEYQFELPKKPKPLRLEAAAFIPKSLSPLQQAEQRIKELAVELATKGSLTPEERKRIIDEMAQQQATINELSEPTTFIFGGPINPNVLAAATDQQPIAPTVPALTSPTASDSTSPTNSAASTQKSFAAVIAQEPKTSQSSAAPQAAPLTANPQNLKGATHKPLPENTIKPEDLEQLVKDGLTNKQLLEIGFVQADINQARENIEARKAAEQKQKGRADRRNAPAKITQNDKAAHEKTRPKPPKPETQQVHSISPEELENLIRAKVSDTELLKKNRGITQEDIDQAKREIARKDVQKEKKADKARLSELKQAQELERKLQSAQPQSTEPKKPKKPQPSASADSEALTEEKKAAQKKQKEQKAAQKQKEDAEKKWLEKLAEQNAQAAKKTTFVATKKITTEDDAAACIKALKDTGKKIDSNYLLRLGEILRGHFGPQLTIAAARIILTRECGALSRELEGKKTKIIEAAKKIGQELKDPISIMETIRGQINDGFIKNAQEDLAQVERMINEVACPEQQATLKETFKMLQMLANVHAVKTTLAIQEGARAFPGLPRIILSTEEQPQNTEYTIARIIEYLDGKRLISNPIIKQEADREIARLSDTITDHAAKKIIDSYRKGFETAAQESLATLQEALAKEIALIPPLLINSPDQQGLAQELATINIPICLAYCKGIINSPETLTDSENNSTMLNSLAQLLEVIATTQNRLALCNPELVEALEFFTNLTTSWKLIMKNSTERILATKLETLEEMIRHLNTNQDPNINNGIKRVACKYFQDLANLEVSSTFPDELSKRLKETIPTMLPLIKEKTYQEANDRFKKLPQSLQKQLKTDFKSFLALPEDTVPTVKNERWKKLFTKALNSYNPDLKIPQEELKSFLATLANTISFGEGANQNLTDFFTLFGQLIKERIVKIDPTIDFLHILNIGDGQFSSEEESAQSNCITTLLEVIQSLPEGQEKNKFMELFELYFKKYKQDEL